MLGCAGSGMRTSVGNNGVFSLQSRRVTRIGLKFCANEELAQTGRNVYAPAGEDGFGLMTNIVIYAIERWIDSIMNVNEIGVAGTHAAACYIDIARCKDFAAGIAF